MAAKKKTAKKKVAKKKVAKKVTKKVAKKTAAKKKTVAKKKTTSKKKVAKKTVKKKVAKKVAKKVSSTKSVSKKKTTKKASTKKTEAKKAVKKKAPAKKTVSKVKKVDGPQDFIPYEPEKNEDYMNDAQLEHFREILLNWKNDLIEEVNRTVDHMKEDASNFPDPADRATQEEEFGLELRTRDRERKLLRKINAALNRIDEGTYGYCEETGEEIGVKRLEARPVATLCIEAQERRELRKRQFSDMDDRTR